MDQPTLPTFEPTDPREALRPMGGRDEMNLAEFPIALLTDRVPDGCKTLVFEDSVFDQHANELVTRRLTITGSDAHGLPTAVDDEILVALIQLTKLANNFTNRRVSFTRYELLKLLGWADRGDSYERIEQAINRWVGVTLYYDKAWWDKESRSWVDAKFHVLETAVVLDQAERRKRKAKSRGKQQELMLSWFSWNEVIFQSFQAENLKRLDIDTYFSLKSSISKRMYRFLDKRFYHRAHWTFDLKEFAFEHVGLSRNYTPPKIKEKLQPALDELTAIGFLEPLAKEERYAKAGRGNWKIILIQKSPVSHQKPRKSELSELEKELITRGVSSSKAAELVEKHPAERIRVKLEVFDWMLATKDKRATKSPAGYLVKSIEDDYAAPKGFETKADRAKREEAEREKRRQAAEARRQKDEAAAREEAIRKQIDAYWDSLDEQQRAKLDAEALERADQATRDAYSNHPSLKNFYLRSLRAVHIRTLLNLPPAPDSE
jgi:hypothetical protein